MALTRTLPRQPGMHPDLYPGPDLDDPGPDLFPGPDLDPGLDLDPDPASGPNLAGPPDRNAGTYNRNDDREALEALKSKVR